MTPEEVGTRLVALIADAGPAAQANSATEAQAGSETEVRADAGQAVRAAVSGGQGYARATVDVPPTHWRATLQTARDDAELACDFFDWLSAVDELEHGFDVVAHLWSTTHRHGVLVRTRVPRDAAEVPSVVDIFPGAGWHERETHEMFGIGFAGHPDLAPLLLPPEFEGHPLRKEFVLASRVAKPWPGAKEPGESEGGGARRQPMRPPGVPAPQEWGPTRQRSAAAASSEAGTGAAGGETGGSADGDGEGGA